MSSITSPRNAGLAAAINETRRGNRGLGAPNQMPILAKVHAPAPRFVYLQGVMAWEMQSD